MGLAFGKGRGVAQSKGREGSSDRFVTPSDNICRQGPSLVYYHATYLFVYKFSYVVIMSIHDSALITYFLCVVLRAVHDYFLSGHFLVFVIYACCNIGSC